MGKKREGWPHALKLWLGWACGICGLALVLAASIGSGVIWRHQYVVHQEQVAAGQAITRNHFWHMLAGDAAPDGSAPGRLASGLRAAWSQAARRDPAPVARQLADEQFYAPLNRYGDINTTLGMTVVDYFTTDAGTRNATTYFEGHLDPGFSFRTTLAYPPYLHYLLSPVPRVEPQGLLVWTGLAWLLPLPLIPPLVLAPGAALGLRVSRARSRRRQRLARAREVAAMPAPARQAHWIVVTLEQMVAQGQKDQQTRTLLAKARKELEWQRSAAEPEQASARLAGLERDLADTHVLGQTYYATLRSLSQGGS